MPLFTEAPLPLLYGCRTTSAPAAAALRAVSSLDAVVDDDDFLPGRGARRPFDHGGDRGGLFEGRDNDRRVARLSHG